MTRYKGQSKHLSAEQKASIVTAMAQCRHAAVVLQMHSERKTIVWREAEVLRNQIDDLAFVFLGDREFFYRDQSHSTHGAAITGQPPGKTP
jgi:hypothetical protein